MQRSRHLRRWSLSLPLGHGMLLLGLVIGAAGCGSDAERAPTTTSTPPAAQTRSSTVVQAKHVLPADAGSTTTVHPRAADSHPLRVRRGNRTFVLPGDHGPPQTQPDGTVVIPQATPKQTVSPASDACASLSVGMPRGRRATLTVPPAPGLQAKLSGNRVVVTFDTGQLPGKCRPMVLIVLLDDDNADYPPARSIYRLHTLGRQTLSLPIPQSLQSAPTVVQAGLGMLSNLHGPYARVKVSP